MAGLLSDFTKGSTIDTILRLSISVNSHLIIGSRKDKSQA